MTYIDLIFLFGLFPVSAVLSLLDRSPEYKNMILIITSLIFFSWGRPVAICLIFLSLFIDWALGTAVEKMRDKSRISAVMLTAADALMNTVMLLVFGHNYLFDGTAFELSDAILPMGMGYYSLRGFSYVYDVYKGKIRAEKNVFCLMTYMVSFHFMCAGPLVRYGDMEGQIRKRELTTEKLNAGLNKMVWGMGKAVVLASVFEKIRDAGICSSEITTLGCWLGMLGLFAQSYFMFTGLCDMSRGLSLISGFVLPVNYRDIDVDELFTGLVKSYNSTVISFFTDLTGISSTKSRVRTALGAVVCGLLMGLWYQVSPTCAAVGLAAGLLVGLEQLFLKDLLEKLPRAVKYIYLIIMSLLIFGGVNFRSFYGYRKWLMGLAGIGTDYTLSVSMRDAVLHNYVLIIIAFCVICTPVRKLITGKADKISAKNRRNYGMIRAVKTLGTVLVFVVSVLALGSAAAG